MKAWTAATAAVIASLMFAQLGEAQPKGKAKTKAPAPAVVAPVAPPEPAGPPPEPLAAAVQAYAAYQTDINALQTGNLAVADDLERALDRAAGVNREALTRGFIAYGALAAAQSPEFVREVRDLTRHYNRAAIIRGLVLDPGYAQRIKGGDDAARLALALARADGSRVFAVGERYKEMAYSLQRQRWANAIAPAQPARVQRMKSLASGAATRNVAPEFAPRLVATPASLQPWSDPTVLGGINFWDGFRAAPPATAAPMPAPARPMSLRVHEDRVQTLNRMTTLAALYALDATKEPEAQADRLLAEGATNRCIELAQVQFYQCMSAARFRYENAFCLGEHALKDMGSCLQNTTVEASASPVAIALPPPPAPAPATPPATQRKKR
jgi:hypothetical protein